MTQPRLDRSARKAVGESTLLALRSRDRGPGTRRPLPLATGTGDLRADALRNAGGSRDFVARTFGGRAAGEGSPRDCERRCRVAAGQYPRFARRIGGRCQAANPGAELIVERGAGAAERGFRDLLSLSTRPVTVDPVPSAPSVPPVAANPARPRARTPFPMARTPDVDAPRPGVMSGDPDLIGSGSRADDLHLFARGRLANVDHAARWRRGARRQRDEKQQDAAGRD
jgi:hypothetical protein